MPKKKKVQPTKSPNDFARQYRIGMKNKRKLGKHSRQYEQG
jgi:hypothetical protein